MAVTTEYLSGGRIQGRSDDALTALSKTWLFDDAEAEEDNTTTWQVSGGNINVLTSSAYDASSYNNNLEARAYVELDADITDKNFTWDIDFSQDPDYSGNNYGGMFALSNYADVRGGQGSGDAIHVTISMNGSGSTARRIIMNYQADASSKAGSTTNGILDQALSDGTVYYLRVKRTSATTVVTTIHSSDANRTAGTAMATNTMTIPSTLNSLDRISMAYGEDSGSNGRMDYLKCFKMILVAETPKDKSTITNIAVGTRYEETDTRKIFRRAVKTFTQSTTNDQEELNPAGSGRIQVGQKFKDGQILVGKNVTKATFYIRDPVGSADGTVNAYIRTGAGVLKETSITTFDAGDFTSSYVAKTFDFPSTTIAADDMIMVSFANGTGSNVIYVATKQGEIDDGELWDQYNSGSGGVYAEKGTAAAKIIVEYNSWVEKGTA